jgi:hypothetical protein
MQRGISPYVAPARNARASRGFHWLAAVGCLLALLIGIELTLFAVGTVVASLITSMIGR